MNWKNPKNFKKRGPDLPFSWATYEKPRGKLKFFELFTKLGVKKGCFRELPMRDKKFSSFIAAFALSRGLSMKGKKSFALILRITPSNGSSRAL